MSKNSKILHELRKKILSTLFKDKHKKSETSFSRERKLTFSKMIILMTRKSVKSLQNILNETEVYLSKVLDEPLVTITKGAYTQAREKLNYTAFIELCTDIRDAFYKEYDYLTYKGFRLLAVDGSMINLPSNEETQEKFNTINVVNQHKDKSKKIVQARISVLYDVLNNVTIDAILSDSKTHEIVLTKEHHLEKAQEDDLIIFDRAYPSYELFAKIVTKHNSNFLMRAKRSTYKKHTQALFDKDSGITDITVDLKPATKALKELCTQEDLPQTIRVRFVQVILPDGEIEVLVTSVLDKNLLKHEDFKELYFKRWGIETFYEIVKNRLSLENFTGTSVLAIQQDFYATMFITNLETIVAYDLNQEIQAEEPSKKHQQKINKSISFNTIKNHAFELLFLDGDIAKALDTVYQLLQTNKVAIRPNRHFDRPTKEQSKVSKGIKSSAYQKRKKKMVF